MALRLEDRWLWDFWTITTEDEYHLFYLQAPRSLIDPDRRHWNASIGHAVSTDLTNWTVLPEALRPGAPGQWDDYTTWTGSVIRYRDRWAMLYTGTSHAEDGLVQRIGLAWSDDLIDWSKDAANPVLEVDADRYELLDLELWHDQAWRDPWLFLDPIDDTVHVYLTARVNHGPGDERGVVAHAFSQDLRQWTVLDPVTAPGVFGHLEIPQLLRRQDKWYLFFSSPGNSEPSPHIGDAATITGTHYLSSSGPTGPFQWESHGVLLGDLRGTWYGAKLINTRQDGWVGLAWDNMEGEEGFAGTLSDPMPVDWHDGPRLLVSEPGRAPTQ